MKQGDGFQRSGDVGAMVPPDEIVPAGGPSRLGFRPGRRRSSIRRRAAAVTSLLVALLALACVPATGSAAPQGPWQLPASDISVSAFLIAGQQIAVAPDGTATVVWQRFNGTNFISQAATRPPGGSFAAPVDLSTVGQDVYNPQIAVAPDGTTTVVWNRSNGTDVIIQATTRPPGGSFAAPVDLSVAGQDAYNPQIAFAPDGTTTVVWNRSNGTNFITQATTRPPSGSFAAPVDLSVAGQSAAGARIAIAPDGTTTVVWQRSNGADDIIQAATRPPSGSFAAPVGLSEAGQSANSAQIAVAPDDGTARVVWQRSNGTNDIIQATTRPPGGSFATPADLSVAGQNAEEPQIAIAPDGTTTLVWQRSNGTNNIIQAATRPPGGPIAAPVDLSVAGQNAAGAQIAIAADGTATVVWQRFNGTNPTIQATTRPPGGSFAAPVDLSTVGLDAYSPEIAIAPDGTATTVWSRFNGTNFIIQQASTTPPSYNLSVTKTGTGSGTVTSSPAGINCGADCSEDYFNYTKVTLTATPGSSSSFTGWSGACLGEAGNTCELEMTETAEATADFKAESPPTTNCSKATLALNNVKKNKKKGNAKIFTKVGEAGKLVVEGSEKVKKFTKTVKKKGTYKLKVKAKGKAARKLRKKGKYKLKPEVVFKPSSDCSNRKKSKKVKLVKRGWYSPNGRYWARTSDPLRVKQVLFQLS